MFDWLVKNSEWLFSGVAITIPITIIGWIYSSKSSVPRQNQSSGHNSTNNQAGRDINIVSTVNQNTTSQLPINLAMPDFHIKQISFSAVDGSTPKYGFEFTNHGGNCSKIKITSQQFIAEFNFPVIAEFNFPVIARGNSKQINVAVEPNSILNIVIVGLDDNGEQYKKCFFGTKTVNGFVFQ